LAFKAIFGIVNTAKLLLMKRLLLYLLLFTAFGVQAQIVMNPDSLSVSVPADTTEFTAAFEVTNNYPNSVSFWWRLERDDSFPDEWEFQVCDVNTSYFIGVDKCPKNNPNVMNSGDSNGNFSVKIKPHGVGANTLMHFVVYADSDFTTQVATLPIHLSVGTVSVDRSTDSREIAVFPNPTMDKFMLQNSKGIDQVEIYNIAGKKVKTFSAVPGKEYGVEDLRIGLYVVRLLDNREKVVKVLRLSKR
jgi:hypothetical protein